jgi:hypothetical protein
MLQVSAFRDPGNLSLLSILVEDELFQMIELILMYDDFDLFRSLVDSVSTMLVVEPIERLQSDLGNLLFSWRGLQSVVEFGEKIHDLRFLIEFATGIDYSIIPKLKEKSEQTLGPPTAADIAKRFLESSRALLVNSLLLGIFFMGGVNILFRRSKNREKAVGYLDELWHHTRPRDADATFANITPVPTSPLWLTQYFLYGGQTNNLWYDRFEFRDFHGVEQYVIEYYLLCLAKLDKAIPIPADGEIERLAASGNNEGLELVFVFARDFLAQVSRPKFQSVLNGIGEFGFDDFVQRDRKSKLGEKSWSVRLKEMLDQTKVQFERTLALLETRLPLDPTKVSACIERVTQSYMEESLIDDVAISKGVENSNEILEGFSRRFNNLPKECLISPASVDCTEVWRGIGHSVASAENEYALGSLTTGQGFSDLDTYEPSAIYDRILDLARKMNADDKRPTVVLMPFFLETDLAMMQKLEYRRGPEVKLDWGLCPVRIVHERKNAVLLVNKPSHSWLFYPMGSSRIKVEVAVNSQDRRKVKVEAQTRGKLQVDQRGTAGSRFPPPEQTST